MQLNQPQSHAHIHPHLPLTKNSIFRFNSPLHNSRNGASYVNHIHIFLYTISPQIYRPPSHNLLPAIPSKQSSRHHTRIQLLLITSSQPFPGHIPHQTTSWSHSPPDHMHLPSKLKILEISLISSAIDNLFHKIVTITSPSLKTDPSTIVTIFGASYVFCMYFDIKLKHASPRQILAWLKVECVDLSDADANQTQTQIKSNCE